MSDTIVAPEVTGTTIESIDLEQLFNPFEDDKSGHLVAHYVSLIDNPEFEKRFGIVDATEMVNIARFNQVEIKAMCGYTWVPKHNPEARAEVCSVCAEIAFNRLA